MISERPKTDIPKARELIMEAMPWVSDLEAQAKLREALSLMTRRVKHNPRTIARKITKPIWDGVVAMHARDPSLTHMEIAKHFNINPGRVSEILSGHRKPPDYSTPGDGMNRRRP